MSYDITIDHESGRHLAVHRFDVRAEEMADQMGHAFDTVMQHLSRVGATVSGPPASCYRMEESEVLQVFAGFVVAAPVEAGNGVEPLQLPDADTATTTHIGPYDELGHAYDALREGAPSLGREVDLAGLMWEEYLSEPDVAPAELRTLVHWELLPA